jgi:hypothetical protein
MTFKENLERLKINAKKTLNHILPKNSLPVFSKDYNDLIDILKEIDFGNSSEISIPLNFISYDLLPFPNDIILDENSGTINSEIDALSITISGHVGEPSKYRVCSRISLVYDNPSNLVSNNQSVILFYYVLNGGATMTLSVSRSTAMMFTSVPSKSNYFELTSNFITNDELSDDCVILIRAKFFKSSDGKGQSVTLALDNLNSSFYIEQLPKQLPLN